MLLIATVIPSLGLPFFIFSARWAHPDKFKPVSKDGVIACLVYIPFNGVDHPYGCILYPAAMDATKVVVVARIAVKPHLA